METFPGYDAWKLAEPPESDPLEHDDTDDIEHPATCPACTARGRPISGRTHSPACYLSPFLPSTLNPNP
jgi:hypothetical protein